MHRESSGHVLRASSLDFGLRVPGGVLRVGEQRSQCRINPPTAFLAGILFLGF